MYTVQITTPPSVEPVAVNDVKALLRLNTSAEDSLIGGWITAARELFERESNLCLINQTVTEYLERVPPQTIYFMRGPVTAINSVKYYDTNGVLQTASGYNTDIITGGMGRVWWPNGQPNVSSTLRPVMQIEAACGYGASGTSVPASIKQAIALLACYWFEMRTPYSEQTVKDVPMGFSAVVDQFKLGNLYDWNRNPWLEQGSPYSAFNPWIPSPPGYWGY